MKTDVYIKVALQRINELEIALFKNAYSFDWVRDEDLKSLQRWNDMLADSGYTEDQLWAVVNG